LRFGIGADVGAGGAVFAGAAVFEGCPSELQPENIKSANNVAVKASVLI
jgi:hypothetical protein